MVESTSAKPKRRDYQAVSVALHDDGGDKDVQDSNALLVEDPESGSSKKGKVSRLGGRLGGHARIQIRKYIVQTKKPRRTSFVFAVDIYLTLARMLFALWNTLDRH